jgi:enoyl-CoA hydratase/carnithine racemase
VFLFVWQRTRPTICKKRNICGEQHQQVLDRTESCIMRADATLTTEEPFVLTTVANGVATLTLNRTERFNLLSSQMIAAIQAELNAIASSTSARVVILAANGKGFCAGHDLKEMRAHAGDKDWQRGLFDACSRMMIRLTEIPQPVIARVQGVATAAGCQLVSMCDLAVAADTATFAMPGVNIGVFCSTPAVGVARNIARKHAMEMLLTGELIDAATALSWGLVNRVVPHSRLDVEIRRFTDIILSRSSATIRFGKQAFYRQIDHPLGVAYDIASEVMARNVLLEDAAEGIDAFLQKRPAIWRGK